MTKREQIAAAAAQRRAAVAHALHLPREAARLRENIRHLNERIASATGDEDGGADARALVRT